MWMIKSFYCALGSPEEKHDGMPMCYSYALCFMYGKSCLGFFFLTGVKEVDSFLSPKIQVFKVTDGLVIVNCQRLFITSEAEKMYNGFYQVCSKKLQHRKIFWSKAQSKISHSLVCTCDSSYAWGMWAVLQNELHLFQKNFIFVKKGTDLQGWCKLLKILKCQSNLSLKEAPMQKKNTWPIQSFLQILPFKKKKKGVGGKTGMWSGIWGGLGLFQF